MPPKPPPETNNIVSMFKAKQDQASKTDRSGPLSLKSLQAELDYRSTLIVTKIDDLDSRVENLEKTVQAILDILVTLKKG